MRLITPSQVHTEELQADVRGKKSRSAPDVATGLTEKMEAFCQAVMAGASFATAYRPAYRADDMVPNSIWNAASRLAADAKVRGRLEQLAEQKEAERRMQAACLTQFVVEGWKQLAQRKIVHQDGTVEEIPPAVRTRNLELIAKHLGMFVERIETADVSDRSADEIEEAIRARLAQHSNKGCA